MFSGYFAQDWSIRGMVVHKYAFEKLFSFGEFFFSRYCVCSEV